jgi:drug/metabolite transporter (DMT)-like permease
MPYVMFCLVCVIWGSSFMLMKLSSPCLTPIEIGAGRAIGGAVALAVLFILTRQAFTVRMRDLLPLTAVVALGFSWPHSLQPWLVERIGGGLVGMSVGFTPLLTLLVAIPMLGHWPTLRQGLGVFGALVFLMILLGDGLRRAIAPWELGLALSVPLFYAVANCTIQRVLKHLPPLELTLLCLASNSCVLLPLSWCVGRPPIDAAAPWGVALTAVTILGVIGTGLATFLFNKLVKEQGSLFATMTINLTPLGAVLWGWASGELVTPTQVFALLGVLVMVVIVQFGAARPTSSNSPSSEAVEEELPL